MKRILIILTVIMMILSVHSAASARNQRVQGSDVVTLITDEEGALRDAPSSLYEIGRAADKGPDIKVVMPEENREYKSPLRVIVLFIPKEGREIDLAKLKVEFLKFFVIDITERALPYTSRDGIKIDKAKLPPGTHRIRVTIGDVEGGVTEQTFMVKVF